MAEKQFTEAGQFGRNLRGALADAYRGFNSGFTKYVQEPLLNLYPQVIANPTYAAVEAGAGAFDVPLNLGRFPYYNIETEDERNKRLIQESEPPEPKATLANRDLLSEYYGGFDNVPVRKAEPVSKQLFRVMFAGKGTESSELYDTKEEADAALKKAGGKGAVAGINFSQKTRGGEILPAEETQARKQKYIDQLNKSKSDKKSYEDNLKRIKSPEYRAERQERSRLANEAKRIKDKAEGAKFEKWRSDVNARRSSEGAVNRYSQQLGLLKQAYSQARQSGDPIGALRLSQAIQAFQSDVPEEMGARKKYFEQNAVRERNAMLAEKARLAQEEDERNRRTALANPDYIYSNPFSGRANFTYQ
jgi:hypothetical protein